jgi:hypothetical protein
MDAASSLEASTAPAALPVPLRELESQIIELVGHLNAANHRFLQLVAEFDRRNGWSDGSTPSCAHWLTWKCGIDLGAAREKVRVAHALEKLPRVASAMARGQLSYSKVRALTRVACAKTEEYFLQIALHGTASHVETLVRQYRRVQEAEELSREARQQAARGLHYFYDEDGSLIVKARLPAEVGALFVSALDRALEDQPVPKAPTRPPQPITIGPLPNAAGSPTPRPADPDDVSAETSTPAPSFAARRADALATIAESFLAHGVAALKGGERHQIVVHVDAETLQERTAGRCELENGPALAAETARRLACDASVVGIVENEEGEPLSVGRKTRTIPPALRRALNARDRGCRFPGCSNKRYVDAHHIQHWAEGGETKPSNLVTLCRFHHRQVHEGRVAIHVLDDGALRFVRPDGRTFESVDPGHASSPSDWRDLSAAHRRKGVHIEKDAAVTLWRGEKMDYGLAIQVLLQHARRSGGSPATKPPG